MDKNCPPEQFFLSRFILSSPAWRRQVERKERVIIMSFVITSIKNLKLYLELFRYLP
jgi:hypothetical protein